jgi:ABC-type uncharacterized transport system permease subunit
LSYYFFVLVAHVKRRFFAALESNIEVNTVFLNAVVMGGLWFFIAGAVLGRFGVDDVLLGLECPSCYSRR